MPEREHSDRDAQPSRERPHDVQLTHLRFLRWLIDTGRLEHPLAGPPSGPLAETSLAGHTLPTAV
jgi:hypothetical protein